MMASKCAAALLICLSSSDASRLATNNQDTSPFLSFVQSSQTVFRAKRIQEVTYHAGSAEDDMMKDLYNKELTACGKQGHCGIDPPAIHAICIVQTPANFSHETKQGDWTADADVAGHHHCVCLGAWSMYVKEEAKEGEKKAAVPDLQCASIPGAILKDDYVDNWATWNGDELPNQIINGLSALFDKCNNDDAYFKGLFCDFVEKSKKLTSEQIKTLSEHAACKSA